MDEYLETLTSYVYPVIQNTVLPWCLIAYHWVSLSFEKMSIYAVKTIHGVIDAHKSSSWVFTERNGMPWVVKGEHLNHMLIYFPEEMLFSGPGSEKGKFNDVVTAELHNADGTLTHDMSSFFHNISWFGTAPSLYEVALVYCLINKNVYPKSVLSLFVLNVTTPDSTIIINLSSEDSKVCFTKWKVDDKM